MPSPSPKFLQTVLTLFLFVSLFIVLHIFLAAFVGRERELKEEEFEDARKCSVTGPFLLVVETAPKHSFGKGGLGVS